VLWVLLNSNVCISLSSGRKGGHCLESRWNLYSTDLSSRCSWDSQSLIVFPYHII
jgi:hypothetical protein